VQRIVDLGHGLPPVCRLGLATRGNTHLRAEDVEHAVDRGLNYLNWCGKPDGLSQAVARMGPRRRDVAVAVQFQARTARAAEKEFARILKELRSDYLDIATLYYVESDQEWRQITAPGGVWDVLRRFRKQGALRMIGLTSHQRKLAADWAQQVVEGGDASQGRSMDQPAKSASQPTGAPELPGKTAGRPQDAPERPADSREGPPSQWPDMQPDMRLDMLMVRYNLAHRGAEREVFPIAVARRMPVVTFTGLRWRALLEPTPSDPEGFQPPLAADCYRFCLSNPAVSVALTAPGDRSHLENSLRLLEDWRAPEAAERKRWLAHGDRVHRHASEFW
jgi:predicted aldo/keto reductase-like oxidoreductase